MKKRIACFTCVAVLVGAGLASAQVTGGVKGGLNLANMSIGGGGSSSVNPGTRESWMLGAFVEVPVRKGISLQPELLYTTKGTEVAGEGGFGAMKLSYFDVPVLLRVDVPTTGKAVPFVYAGPNFGFLLSAKASVTVAGTTEEQDVKNELKTTDIGIAFGGGVRFGRLLVEARYVQGLTNILEPATAGGGTAKNHVFKIIGGVRF